MPIATLKFKLPEELSEFEDAQHGSKYLTTLQDLDNYFRDLEKHSNNKKIVEKASWVREVFWEILKERDITLW